MKIVVGIGNPGKRYQHTRHNLGARVVGHLARQEGIRISRRRFDALVGQGLVACRTVLLVKPQTYVNLSGSAVAPLLRWHRCSTADLLVVCDDITLELGTLRLRPRGSSGGHNGLSSIIDWLGTNDFARLRVGIGRGRAADPVDHVLGRFGAQEGPAVAATVPKAAEAIVTWLDQGIENAMNAFNG